MNGDVTKCCRTSPCVAVWDTVTSIAYIVLIVSVVAEIVTSLSIVISGADSVGKAIHKTPESSDVLTLLGLLLALVALLWTAIAVSNPCIHKLFDLERFQIRSSGRVLVEDAVNCYRHAILVLVIGAAIVPLIVAWVDAGLWVIITIEVLMIVVSVMLYRLFRGDMIAVVRILDAALPGWTLDEWRLSPTCPRSREPDWWSFLFFEVVFKVHFDPLPVECLLQEYRRVLVSQSRQVGRDECAESAQQMIGQSRRTTRDVRRCDECRRCGGARPRCRAVTSNARRSWRP